MPDTALAGPGHNLPPALPSGDELRRLLADENTRLRQRHDELLAAEARLPTIIDDETAGKAGDYIKQTTACIKALEGARVAAKEPFLSGARGVDGFFRALIDPLGALKTRIERGYTNYLRAKADNERRILAEAEAKAIAEAATKASVARAAAARLATENDLTAALAAEEAARQAAADAAAATKAADVAPAELSRTRGDMGSVASLRRFWDFNNLDRQTVDLEALRPHFALADIEKALRAFVKAGGREIRGAAIFENTTATVR